MSYPKAKLFIIGGGVLATSEVSQGEVPTCVSVQCAPRARDCTQRRVRSDEAKVRVREGPLARTEEERQPTVCYLCSGELVYGSQELLRWAAL